MGIGRPRTVSDEQILAALARVISRVGPARLTLADVAAEAGIAAPTVAQRFGSKRGLLLAFSARAAAQLASSSRERVIPARPLEALLSGLLAAPRGIGSPVELANHLAFLQLELADPELRQHVCEHAAAARRQAIRLLDAAIARGDLVPCDTTVLADALLVAYNGALITWAMCRQDDLATWLRGQLEFTLQPFGVRQPQPDAGHVGV